MNIKIRPIRTHDEYRAVEQLQREVWSLDDAGIAPSDLMVTAQKNGGLALGAFADSLEGESEQLVGLVFGFVGLSPDGKLAHCSHILGVLPTHRNQNIGYHLKLAQRENVLAQGLELITWTFDPLESRNANHNFHKLGATCRIYLPNLYGDMRDTLNVGLSSDRFQVDWHIASTHVINRIRGTQSIPSLSALQEDGVPILNPLLSEEPSCPPKTYISVQLESRLHRDKLRAELNLIGTNRLLIQIPPNFQAIKLADMELARAWRLHTRALFETTFAEGYVVTNLLFEEGQSYYLLEKDWRPDED